MKRITTVCGDIRPEELGVTSMHDHTIYDAGALMQGYAGMYGGMMQKGENLAENREQKPDIMAGMMNMLMARGADLSVMQKTDLEFYTEELSAFRELGGQSLCDCSPYGSIKNDRGQIRELSVRSGVKLVVCSGFYLDPFIPDEYKNQEERMGKKPSASALNC